MMVHAQRKIIAANYRLLFSEQQIRKRTIEMAGEIADLYPPEIPIMIGVLNGAFIFLADLIRYINIDCEIDFLRISSYGNGQESSGHIKVLKPLSADIKGRHVLVVEDIIDSGLSVRFLIKMLSAFEPASLRLATLLRKKSGRMADIKVDFTGFDIDDKYVVGYGLDEGQKKRNLRAVYVVEQK
jgi:hypoxanthine phosphoribosyltransferase